MGTYYPPLSFPSPPNERERRALKAIALLVVAVGGTFRIPRGELFPDPENGRKIVLTLVDDPTTGDVVFTAT